MRVSPILATVVAITAPLSSSLSANAQTLDGSKEKAKVFSSTNQEHRIIKLLQPTPVSVANPEVIKSTFSSIKTAQNPSQTSPSIDISPSNTPQNNIPIQRNPNQIVPNTPQNNIPIQRNPNQIVPNTPQNNIPIQRNPNQIVPNTPQNNAPIQRNPSQPPEQSVPPTAPNSISPEQEQESQAPETRVLVSEVQIRSEIGQLTPDLESQIYKVIRTQPGRTTTRSQLQDDINSIFSTGFFSNVQAVPEDTPLGVRVSFVVRPNPVLNKVQVQANSGTNVRSVIPPTAVDDIFRNQYGKILNLRDLQEGIKQLTKRYQDQGYVLANVIGSPQVSPNGVVTLQVAEGVVENIRVRFRNKQGEEVNQKGQPIRGRTQPYIITRELQLKPGQVFNRNIVQKDLQRVFGLGLFQDVNVSLDPGSDPSKVDVVVNVVERNSGSIGAGAGISSANGLFGTVSYQQQNLNGRNQKLGAELEIGQRDSLLFNLRFTDPWIAGDPYRTSYTADIFRRRSISLIFDGKNNNIQTVAPKNAAATDGDRPRVVRLGGGVNFTRPLSKNPYEASEWTASAGFQYQRVTIQDSNGNSRNLGKLSTSGEDCIANKDCLNLTKSGGDSDDLLLVQLGLARDRRNNPLVPTKGSFLRFGLDQSVPIGSGSILLTRLRGSYSQYLPVKLTHFSKKPETIAFNIQAGTILGDLPPYEAFTLGGSNSVRGYDEGRLGSGRTFLQTSLEYRFPVFSIVSGALFFDFGSDLGTSDRASSLLNKPGTGFGYGLGVRVQSPLGPIRVDYGLNGDGGHQINFGIGERF
ncbi:BamA/TamA family outer membrane protein [Aetokthonos hydrillicola Thurmond2011]|uniref:BamA/TamA family outer membrane protein n=1 Tax=Aetokthonos hydrillicola Thurmond2011 TaxID=2712845 RepID=A0AAP5M625_9CYAN|nr:BamA/TamA family outer membrane protein [Aetokthonos hydrillicola]MBO3460535.1 BamA/TamA family outer membrane protein [Aetokthonos hydrillicola CCALA 1050]MBW4585337.1 BamA/TamA family outer membrane protein [Aetokthonos hydrillicola CCALA 1050]MDR9896526.1 BamA/TamA family outer membrane protein [Aetokthonos hydrillicola Thurmond2011]